MTIEYVPMVQMVPCIISFAYDAETKEDSGIKLERFKRCKLEIRLTDRVNIKTAFNEEPVGGKEEQEIPFQVIIRQFKKDRFNNISYVWPSEIALSVYAEEI